MECRLIQTSNKAFLPVRWIENLAHGFFEAGTPRNGCKMQYHRGAAFTPASKQALRVFIQAMRKFYQFCTDLWESVGDMICYKALV
jgi:hypothetical protein